jgi:hypothetical protein
MSPIKHQTLSFLLSLLFASATPVAIGMIAPTIAEE